MRAQGNVIARLLAIVIVLTFATMSVPASAEATTSLREGSRGTAVVELQTRLQELRYDVGSIDGIFGSSTKHAVVAFQKVNGLERDGIVGSRTHAALRAPVVPKVRHSRSGTYVEVDLTRQVLLLARDGRVRRIVDVSTGTASTPTPVGSFRVERRIDGWRTSSLGTLWRPAYFHRGYAIHGSTSVPPYPASHGCVRLTIASTNRLWNHLPVGTPVRIYR
jgi:N-acetylmuramoyl-L-alanine amidase